MLLVVPRGGVGDVAVAAAVDDGIKISLWLIVGESNLSPL
jgi:hypothetical protein